MAVDENHLAAALDDMTRQRDELRARLVAAEKAQARVGRKVVRCDRLVRAGLLDVAEAFEQVRAVVAEEAPKVVAQDEALSVDPRIAAARALADNPVVARSGTGEPIGVVLPSQLLAALGSDTEETHR